MDVSGWALAKRMKIPDQYFPDREIVSVYDSESSATTFEWGISGVALPDPVCIWELGIQIVSSGSALSYVRLGLRSAVPTSEAEMNGAKNIFPDLGDLTKTPPAIYMAAVYPFQMRFTCKKGFVTAGDKFVMELYNVTGVLSIMASMLISGLPTDVPAWAGVS